jgi:predicted dehydrogenase
MQRRAFLAAAQARVLGANDRVRAGVIGAGGRGQFLTSEFKEIGAEMAAVCDAYEPNLQAGLKAANTGAREYRDYRRLLEDKSLDAVVVASPDHWHAQMVIDAVHAGKDVYVEKPMTHTIKEGHDVVAAVRSTKRVVQVGTQRRSSPLFLDAKKVMDSGATGPVRLVNSWWVNYQAGLSPRKLEGQLDWKQWLGPAPAREVDPVRFFNWYYYYDYSGGLLIGQAAHIVDFVHWFMGSKAPTTVSCMGGEVNLKGAEIPETACLTAQYPENYLSVFTIGYQAMRYALYNDQMNQFHGTKARFDVGRENYALWPQSLALDMKPSIEVKQPGSFTPATRAHIRNFLECIQTRQDPNAPVEAGLSTVIVLSLAIDSLRQGRVMGSREHGGRPAGA